MKLKAHPDKKRQLPIGLQGLTAAAVLVCLALSCPPARAALIMTNVAPSGQIINSVSYNKTFAAANVIDGNTNETAYSPVGYWLGPTGVASNYFVLDLVRPYPISSIALFNTHNQQYNDYGTAQFQILAANAVQSQTNSLSVNRYFPLDGDVNDSSSNALNAVVLDFAGGNQISGTYSNDVPAPLGTGSSIYLDGSGERVEFLDVPGAPHPVAFTLSLWVKFLSPPAPLQPCSVIVRTTGSGQEVSAWSHQIRLTATGQFQCWIYDQDTGGNPNVVSTTVVQSNTWYHVAVTAQNSGFMHLYVNGVEEGTPAAVKTIWTGGSEFALGTGSGGGYGVEPMLIDDVGVWYSALSAQNIQQLSNGQKPSTFSGNVIIGPNLVNPELILSGTLSATAGQNVIQPDIFSTNNGLTAITAQYLQFTALTGINGDNNTGLDEFQVFAQVDDTPPSPSIGTSVYLTYPYGPINFVLQESPTLNSPAWVTVPSTPVRVGTNLQVFVPADQRNYFFRLARP